MKKLTAALFAAVALSGCVSTAKQTSLPQGTQHYTVDTPCNENSALKIGESITVQVYENLSTGYSWSVVGAEKFDVKSAYIAAVATEPMIVGRGQDKTFIFTAKTQGTDQIALHHGRGWEGQSPAQWVCKVTVE